MPVIAQRDLFPIRVSLAVNEAEHESDAA